MSEPVFLLVPDTGSTAFLTAFGGRDDRFFPIGFQRELVRSRLGLELVELPGGHLNALSEPAAVAEALLGF